MSQPGAPTRVANSDPYGLVVVCNGNLERTLGTVEALLVHSTPQRIAIVDRGRERSFDWTHSQTLGVPSHYWCVGEDLGVGGSIEIGMRYMTDCVAVLITDDRIDLDREVFTGLWRIRRNTSGAAVCLAQEGKIRRFRWFPSILDTQAWLDVGPISASLFEWYDDLEYESRLLKQGHVIHFTMVTTKNLNQRPLRAVDYYLRSRNLSYLRLRRGLMRGMSIKELSKKLHPRSRGTWEAVLRGFLDGVMGRMGPPRKYERNRNSAGI